MLITLCPFPQTQTPRLTGPCLWIPCPSIPSPQPCPCPCPARSSKASARARPLCSWWSKGKTPFQKHPVVCNPAEWGPCSDLLNHPKAFMQALTQRGSRPCQVGQVALEQEDERTPSTNLLPKGDLIDPLHTSTINCGASRKPPERRKLI